MCTQDRRDSKEDDVEEEEERGMGSGHVSGQVVFLLTGVMRLRVRDVRLAM